MITTGPASTVITTPGVATVPKKMVVWSGMRTMLARIASDEKRRSIATASAPDYAVSSKTDS
jgi:hypothetical protein